MTTSNTGELKLEIIDILSAEMGILAEVIFDEILQTLGIDEHQLSRVWAGKFVRLLDSKLPEEIPDRQQIIRDIAGLLIDSR